jgi:hypothetical protein
MLERFQTLQNCVIKNLSALKSELSLLTESSHFYLKLQQHCSQLRWQPKNYVHEKLIFLTFQFMLDELAEQKNKTSQELKIQLLARTKQHRTLISDVFQ